MLQGFFYHEYELRCRVTVYTQLAVGIDGLHTLMFVSAETYEVYIGFMLFIHVISL